MIPKIIKCDYDHIILNDDDPQIIHIKKFISGEECDQLICYMNSLKFYSAPTVVNGKRVVSKDRNATAYENRLGKWGNEQLMNLDNKIMKLTNWESFKTENWNFIKYGIGEKYRPHFDYHNKESLNNSYRQRCGTFILYLKKATKGGLTCFPHLKLNIEADAGDAIFFNYTPEKTKNSFHGGTAVIEGEKIIVTRWFNFIGIDDLTLFE